MPAQRTSATSPPVLALLARRLTAAEASPVAHERLAVGVWQPWGGGETKGEIVSRTLFVEARRVARRLRVRPRTCMCRLSYSCRHDNRQVVDVELGVQSNDRIRIAVGLRLGIRREPNCSTRRRARLCSQGRGAGGGAAAEGGVVAV